MPSRSREVKAHSLAVMTNRCKVRPKIRNSDAINAGCRDTEELDTEDILQVMQM